MTMRARTFTLAMLVAGSVAVPGDVAAEPRRAARPQALAAGLSMVDVAENQVLPFLTGSAALDLDDQSTITADVFFFTSGDRIFGPRLMLRGGARFYARDGLANPYAAVHAVLYHELDVDYSGSDRSQIAATSGGAAFAIGHELVAASGLAWTVEASVFYLRGFEDHAPTGVSLAATTTLGYRF